MQAVILAAGKSSRFWPLNQKHKCLFKIMGKPLLCYTLESLKNVGVKEIIIVQGIKKDIEGEMKKYLFSGLKIGYAIQKTPSGTGDALFAAKDYLKEKFLVLNGDDFYGSESIKKCLTKFPAILVKKTQNPLDFAVVLSKRNFIEKIIEKPKKPLSNLINMGCYFIPKTILREKIKKSSRGEYEIVDYINCLAKKTKVFFIQGRNWFPLNYPWQLLDISVFLLKNLKSKIKGKIEKECYLKLPAIIENGALIRTGSYIEGPVYIGENCQIGQDCYIGPFTILESGSVVGKAVKIKHSIIGSKTNVSSLSSVAYSVVGENCYLGPGAVLANLKSDKRNVILIIKGKKINIQQKRIGVVLGRGVKTGVNVSVMPGVFVGPNSTIKDYSLVKKNIFDDKIV